MTSSPQQPFHVGTLSYDKRGLFRLFFWLMWNDFSIMLLEQIGNLNQFQMRDHGATLEQIALVAVPAGLIQPFINPIVSTWSDRLRGPHGRRRPFLFWATPPFAFFLALTPYMPTIFHCLARRHAWFAQWASHWPMNGSVMMLGACISLCTLCNAVVLAIFSYLYWDVVPNSHMGRFQSLSRNASVLAGLVWSFFIFGLATSHVKSVYVGTACVCLAIYLTSVWQIKEGEYPPPDQHHKGGLFAPVLAYCVECFSQPYYLWIFLGSFLFQLGNGGLSAQSFYLHYRLKLDYWALGWASGWGQVITTGFGLLFGFALGAFTDRLKGVRLMAPVYVLLGLVQVAATFLVVDKITLMIYSAVAGIILFALSVIIGAFTIEVFPREKLGQFCSAQVLSYQFALTILLPLIGHMFDRLGNFRLGYLWMGTCYLLAAIVYVKVHLNWEKRHGRPPVPHLDQII